MTKIEKKIIMKSRNNRFNLFSSNNPIDKMEKFILIHIEEKRFQNNKIKIIQNKL